MLQQHIRQLITFYETARDYTGMYFGGNDPLEVQHQLMFAQLIYSNFGLKWDNTIEEAVARERGWGWTAIRALGTILEAIPDRDEAVYELITIHIHALKRHLERLEVAE